MTLLHLALKQVYYHCINTCLNFISNGYWHCTCDKFQGCRKRNGEQVYCYICRDLKTYGQWDFEKVKDELIKLMLFLKVLNVVQILMKQLIIFGCVIMSTRGEMMWQVK